MKLIIYKKPDGSVIVNKPLRGRITLSSAQWKFINARCVDKIPTHMEGVIEAVKAVKEVLDEEGLVAVAAVEAVAAFAGWEVVDVVSELTVPQRICLDGRVITTEAGTIDGNESPGGTIVRRFNAEKAGIPYDELEYEIVDYSDFDDDKLFRDAWRFDKSKAAKRTINVPAAKEIAHENRRYMRAVEFRPIDHGNMNLVLNAEGEAARQAIREKYADMQIKIDGAETVAGLKTALGL